MNKKIIILGMVLAATVVGFMFKDQLLGLYNTTAKNLQNFQKNDLGNIVEQIKKEILAPTPLHIGGNANNAVFVKSKIIAQTNIQRYDNGQLPPLLENMSLNASAKTKADDMFSSQYFEHISPSGVGPGELVKNHGYDYILTGENLILGNFKSEAEIVQAWMNSPGHRANIVNNRFTEIGVAIVKGTYKGETVWIGVQEFGLPLSACPQSSDALKAQIEVNKVKLDDLIVQIDAKRLEIERISRNDKKYNKLVDEYNTLVAEYNPLNDQTKSLINRYNTQINTFNACVSGNR